MIRLVFTKDRETLSLEIDNKVIVYRDRKYPKGFQFMPKDPNFKRIVLFSRNKLPMDVITWIENANKGKNLEQWQNAKNDEAIVPIVIKDAELNGCVFRERIDSNNNEKFPDNK